MKDKKFRYIYSGKIVSALEFGKDSYLELWNEAKRLGDIPEDSADYCVPILPPDKDLIEQGLGFLEDNEEYEEI
ncbi:hypothetical protein ABHN03_16845 [Paenibacillus sp. NRS-1775]|uniref:hypothetical protein n=1 Tax=unclassified Paenibacillus TaxID=185978 RepID=UPI003D2C275B